MTKNISRLGAVLNAIIVLLVAGLLAYSLNLAMQRMPIRQYFENTRTNAVWDWRNVTSHNLRVQESAAFLRQHQINTVYIDIGGVITRRPGDGEKPVFKPEYAAAIRKYVEAMTEYKIRVVASAGDKYWSQPDKRWIPVAIMDYVIEYNKANPQLRLAGVEYDIESYNQEGFEKASYAAKGIVLSEYLDTVDTLTAKLLEAQKQNRNFSDIELGFAVPYWFDNQNKNIRSVEWGGKTGPTIFHIMDTLNVLPRSNIVVMAYRNAARGNEGSIALSRTEVQYAQYKSNRVKVIIGQETTNVEPSKITFYGKSTTELSQEIAWVEGEYAKTGAYGGIAINDLSGYLALPDK